MTVSALLDSIAEQRILVVGDVMLDEYIYGTATRISPEAPVMVVKHSRTASLPGGAANVAKNVAAFGAEAFLVGVVGEDEGAALLQQSLEKSGFTSALIAEAGRSTTRKTRVLADSRHQVLRIDREDSGAISDASANRILEAVEEELPNCTGVVISDYLKGCITQRVAGVIYQLAKAAWKPVVVNPKPQSLEFYRGATLITLNRLEGSQAWGREIDVTNALQAGEELRTKHRADAVVITLGDEGMAVSGPQQFIVPATRVEVADPAGAGDTVAATLALGVAATGFSQSVFELAAHAAACVVQHVGVATVTREDLDLLRNSA